MPYSELQPHLFVIGLGIAVPNHVTIQASEAMARCTELYSLVQEPAHLWVPSHTLQKIKVFNILEWYVEGSIRIQNYEYVAASVFSAIGNDGSVGYVTYGNPMAFDRVAQNLLELCRNAGFHVQVVPGISSIDTVLCDLKFDMAPAMQVFEASWLVACQIQPRLDIPVLLMQVGTFGSLRTHYTRRQDGSSLTELINYLGKLYPLSHPTYLVRSTAQKDYESGICKVPLDSLCGVTSEELSGASLYIPALTPSQPRSRIIDRMAGR
jgi:uncharacterized protein YabN with tetrapyrrole methylase and pyrophosphatase domain